MSDAPRPCDHTSVGAIIRNSDGDVLTFRRATPPAGIAAPAGHIDDHGGPDAAIIAEVAEEVGLTVIEHTLLAYSTYRPGACRRPGGDVGHDWWIYEVQVEGELAPSWRETRDAAWRSQAELNRLAYRTVARARDRVSAEDFAASPGIEPVWFGWFALFGVITATTDELYAVDRLLRRERTGRLLIEEGEPDGLEQG